MDTKKDTGEKALENKAGVYDEVYEDSTRLYIGNLYFETSPRDIREAFEKYGPLVSIQIKTGFAFIEYETTKQAITSREAMNLKKFNGRTIIVRRARKINFNKLDPKAFMDENVSIYEDKEDSTGKKLTRKTVTDPHSCFVCGKSGHWKRECEIYQSNGKKKRGSSSDSYSVPSSCSRCQSLLKRKRRSRSPPTKEKLKAK